MPQKSYLTLLATLILFASAFAQAQYINPFTGSTWNNPVSSSVDTILWGDLQMRTLMLPYERQADESPPPPSATSFAPTSGLRTARSFADSLSDDPEIQGELTALFEHGREEFERQARAEGKPNNVAMALNFFILANYYVYTGGTEANEAAQASLWATLHGRLATSPSFAAASDEERQELYETFVILASLPLYGYLAALQEGNAELAAVFREFAGQNLEALLEVSPDALRFTATGLEIGP